MTEFPSKSHRLRSIGALLFGASSLCGLIAYEKYRSATVTAQAFNDAVAMEAVEFKASVPMETHVAGFLCVLLAVAAIRCFGQWYAERKPATDDLPLLP